MSEKAKMFVKNREGTSKEAKISKRRKCRSGTMSKVNKNNFEKRKARRIITSECNNLIKRRTHFN